VFYIPLYNHVNDLTWLWYNVFLSMGGISDFYIVYRIIDMNVTLILLIPLQVFLSNQLLLISLCEICLDRIFNLLYTLFYVCPVVDELINEMEINWSSRQLCKSIITHQQEQMFYLQQLSWMVIWNLCHIWINKHWWQFHVICDVGRENVPLVAESEAEKITIFHRVVIDYAFLGLIGFYHWDWMWFPNLKCVFL